jgi:hypothetical protein
MADIFEEVEEGLRQDRYSQMLRKHGPLGAAVIAAVVLGVAGREGWSALQDRASQRSSDAFASAQAELDMGNLDAAMAGFAALSQDGTGSYGALAAMQEAAAAVAAGSLAEGARLFDEAASRARDPLLADLARLKAAYLIADTVDLPTLEARLAPLMERGAPYELIARELLGAKALAVGDHAKAREAYIVLTVSLEAPGGVRGRAEEALAMIEAAEAAAPTDDEG